MNRLFQYDQSKKKTQHKFNRFHELFFHTLHPIKRKQRYLLFLQKPDFYQLFLMNCQAYILASNYISTFSIQKRVESWCFGAYKYVYPINSLHGKSLSSFSYHKQVFLEIIIIFCNGPKINFTLLIIQLRNWFVSIRLI